MFRVQDVFLIPFSVLWCGFAIFWEASVLSSIRKAPAFFALWGIPFVAIGLYMVFGRFIADALARARTLYGVTDRRVIIVSGLTTRSTKSLLLPGLTEIEVQERSDGRGSLVFGRSNGYANLWGRGWPGTRRELTPMFEGVENPRRIYDIIRRAQLTLSSAQQS
jgi:hypothetical protein